ncbi:hypothetical protein IEO21_08767 [Rhodonia placenta]|nr:hypothetical protein IEO21_11220 [Postia placenta]KAF9794068.1 hypothetical protein IEO21_11217 [Postia placenta]KAF9794310.1 hypothetical protein IEO21_11206 [Postia placenta]KAF9797634.1 hypothetical protein IEO21_10839 [Postia placenta]KAF9797817.1 hypothetical protein IEO21_10832 [Postia placenta]
MVSEAQT